VEGEANVKFESLLEDIGEGLVKYSDAWSEANNLVADFGADEENKAMFKAFVAEFRANRQEDPDGRDPKLSEADFNRLIGVVHSSALRLSRPAEYLSRTPHGQSLIVDGKFEMGLSDVGPLKKAQQTMQAKSLTALFSTIRLQYSENVESLEALPPVLFGLRKELVAILKPQHKLERKILKKINAYIDEGDLADVLALIDAYIEGPSSESVQDQALTGLLALDHEIVGADSVIGYLVDGVCESIEVGSLATAFINSESKSGEHTVVGFLANRLSEIEANVDIAELFGAEIENWPDKLRELYQSFSKAIIGQIKMRAREAHRTSDNLQWIVPDPAQQEAEYDRVFVRFYGAYKRGGGYKRTDIKRTPGRTRPESRPRSNPLPSAREVKKQESLAGISLAKRRLVPQGNGSMATVYEATPTSDTRATVMTAYGYTEGKMSSRQEKLVSQMTQIVEMIVSDPSIIRDSTSIHSLINYRIRFPDRKTEKVYRINPSKLAGVSTSRTTRRSRLLFVNRGNRLVLLRGFEKHEDYETFVRHNQRDSR